MENKYLKECSVCRLVSEKAKPHDWYRITEQQRRDYFFKEKMKISHTYCPTCTILHLEVDMGLKPSEIEQILKEINENFKQ